MNDNFTHTDQLIRYLDGELNSDETALLQEKINSAPEMAAELESLRHTRDAVKTYGLKKTIGSLHAEMMQEMKPGAVVHRIGIRQIARYSSRIAAVLLLVLGSIILYQYFSATPESLYRDADTAFQLRETRGAQTSLLEDAYRTGNDTEVLKTFPAIKNHSAEDYFLQGNAALHTNNAAIAIQSFEALAQKNKQDNTHFFEEDAQYFLALAYLRNNEPAKALPIFTLINASPGHPYHAKVGNWFMRKLERLADH